MGTWGNLYIDFTYFRVLPSFNFVNISYILTDMYGIKSTGRLKVLILGIYVQGELLTDFILFWHQGTLLSEFH